MAINNIKKTLSSTEKTHEISCLCSPFVILLASMIEVFILLPQEKNESKRIHVINGLNSNTLNAKTQNCQIESLGS